MRNLSDAEGPMEPRTHVGRWLLATLLNQQAERQRLSRMLNNGERCWNYDEPGVMEVACQLAVRRLFSESIDVREITKFVMELRSRVHSTTPPDQLEAESLIRAALGDHDVVVSDINSMNIFTAYGAILGHATQRLALSEDDIRKLIRESERLAFEQGWKPPLAD
jgi:hypothetical protein